MGPSGIGIWVSVVFAAGGAEGAAFDAAVRQSDVVVVAGVAPSIAGSPLDKRGFELVATRVLKGSLAARRIRIRPGSVPLPDYAPYGVWFLSRQKDGAFGISTRPDEGVSHGLSRFFRTNRRSFPGLESRRAGAEPVLTLGLDSRLGSASIAPDRPVAGEDVKLLAQITNLGPNRTFLPPLDGSDYGARYPKVILEITDATGLPPKRVGIRGECGVITTFRIGDFVELHDGEALMFDVPAEYAFRPGTYRARLRYVAKRSAMGVTATARVGKVYPEVQPYLEAIWEGPLDSNWLAFTVAASPASK